MSTSGGALLFIASMLCFAVGFGVAWVRARRRVQAKIQDRLVQEMEQRMAEEVLRRLREGKLHEDIEQTLQEQGYSAGSGTEQDKPSDASAAPSAKDTSASDDDQAGAARNPVSSDFGPGNRANFLF